MRARALLPPIAAVVLAGCASTSKPPAQPSQPQTPATSAAAPAPSPSDSLAGPIKTIFEVSDGSGDKMSVRLVKVIDPAQGADEFTTPDHGKRFVGAVFVLRGITGHFSDDADNDALIIGTNGQTYDADFDDIAGYTNFNGGEFNVRTGERSKGAVTFQLPLHVRVAKVEWDASSGFGGAPAEWTISP
jgi:hypothetical protein